MVITYLDAAVSTKQIVLSVQRTTVADKGSKCEESVQFWHYHNKWYNQKTHGVYVGKFPVRWLMP
jgi:hypothetical protein